MRFDVDDDDDDAANNDACGSGGRTLSWVSTKSTKVKLLSPAEVEGHCAASAGWPAEYLSFENSPVRLIPPNREFERCTSRSLEIDMKPF